MISSKSRTPPLTSLTPTATINKAKANSCIGNTHTDREKQRYVRNTLYVLSHSWCIHVCTQCTIHTRTITHNSKIKTRNQSCKNVYTMFAHAHTRSFVGWLVRSAVCWFHLFYRSRWYIPMKMLKPVNSESTIICLQFCHTSSLAAKSTIIQLIEKKNCVKI